MNSSGHRASALLLLAAGLVACPKEEGGPNKPSSEPGVSAELANSDKTIDKNIGTSGGTQVGATQAQVQDVKVEEGSCAGGPGWTKLPLCKKDDSVFAVGIGPGTKSASLGRSAAAGKARSEVINGVMKAGDGTFLLKSTEVLDTFSCKDGVYALAKAPSSEASAALPECDAAAIAARSTAPKGCPEWSNRVSWRDGENLFGVGIAEGIKNHELGISAAVNRANAEIAAMLEREITRQGSSTSQKGSSAGLKELERQQAECGGDLYVLLKAKHE